jgi:hypothetical protein
MGTLIEGTSRNNGIDPMYKGGGILAWCSDYAQIYCADANHPALSGIDALPTDAYAQGYYVAQHGFAIFTADTLRQHVQIAVHDSEPDSTQTEPLSDDAWTRNADFSASFPSGQMTLSSPSGAGSENHGPHFRLIGTQCRVRVCWLEYEEGRYDAFRPKPDVIRIEIWPA